MDKALADMVTGTNLKQLTGLDSPLPVCLILFCMEDITKKGCLHSDLEVWDFYGTCRYYKIDTKEVNHMDYQEKREKRISIFEDTIQYCERTPGLVEAVMRTRENTMLYKNPLEDLDRPHSPAAPCRVTVTDHRSLEAAQKLTGKYPDSRVGVLNFASASNPGGGVVRGSNAQEECLCRCTTLYPCLNVETLWQEYYHFHRNRESALYTDTCIYTPGIVGIKRDQQWPELMDEKEWFMVDVISCPAPNLRRSPSNQMNPFSGKPVHIEEERLKDLLKHRMKGILQVAASHQIEALVLGAFGCGAFCNPPHIAALAYAEALEEYRSFFKEVEFAVYCPGEDRTNYEEFLNVLG